MGHDSMPITYIHSEAINKLKKSITLAVVIFI